MDYRRVQQRGHFVQPQSSNDAANDIEMLAAPVRAFVRDCCEVGPQLSVAKSDICLEWTAWADDQGMDAGSKNWFGHNLLSAVPGLKPGKDDHEPVYRGITMNPRRPVAGF